MCTEDFLQVLCHAINLQLPCLRCSKIPALHGQHQSQAALLPRRPNDSLGKNGGCGGKSEDLRNGSMPTVPWEWARMSQRAANAVSPPPPPYLAYGLLA